MKTKSLQRTGSRMLAAIALIIGIGLFSSAKACTANFTYTLGANGHVTFTSTSTGYTNPSFTWNPGDGKGTMYGANPSHIYTANGTYNVFLTAQDSLCMDTITIPITITNVTTPCTLSASFTYTLGAHGVVKFTSTSTGTNANTLYYWTFGDGSPRTQGKDTITHKYVYDKWYYAYLTVEDSGTAYCIDSNYIWFQVTTGDSNSCTTLHTSFSYTVNTNGHAHLYSTSIGGAPSAMYYWDPGDGSGRISTGYNNYLDHIYTKNKTYNAMLAIYQNDSTSCSDSIVLPVTISNVDTNAPCNLSANFTITYDSNGQVKLTSTSTGTHPSTQYYWNPGDGSGTIHWYDTLTHKYPFIGNYTATLIINDTGAGYCMDSISYPVNIYNRDSLVASFTYVADSLTAGKYDFTSTSQGTNANTYYKWTPGDGNPSDSGLGMTYYTHTYSVNGPYSATLTIWYTIIPKVNSRLYTTGRYSLSSYTKVIHVTTVTGIASITDGSGKFNLYPNPNKGQFRVNITNLGQDQKAEVDITNLLGEVINKIPTEVTNNTLNKDIDLQTTPAGIYFVKVITADKVYTSKLVIER